jgi:Calcineurin-like phosphoesterase/Purple acid Phosphatase, N-terminal domain
MVNELSRRQFLGSMSVIYGAVTVGPVLWNRPEATAALPRSPRVGWGADPRTTLTISWATDGPVRNPVVDVGVDDGFGRLLAAETRTVPGWPVNYHRVTVDGLDAGRAYRYRIRHDGAAGPARTVRTAPVTPGPFTFAAYGDQGTTAGAEQVIGILADAAPAFTFCLGDLCYADLSGGVAPAGRVDHAAWDRWLGMVSQATAATAAVLPAVGNHEIENGMGHWGYDGYLTRIALPGNGSPGLPTTWSARWGNVALVAADANDVSTEITRNNGVSGGGQGAWLERTLAGLRADPAVDWIVVGFHHCAYCTNTLHGSDAGVRGWAPLFDRYGVDLVINGHNHCYERTHPLRAGAPVAEVTSGGTWASAGGVTYLCAGGGGGQTFPMSVAPLSTVTVEGGARIPERAPWSAFRYNDHSLLLLDVDPPGAGGTTTLTVRAVSATGAEFDRVTLLRRRDRAGAAEPAAAERPAA